MTINVGILAASGASKPPRWPLRWDGNDQTTMTDETGATVTAKPHLPLWLAAEPEPDGRSMAGKFGR